MMEVYHTSNARVEQPDTHHSRKTLDFGPGFYFTTFREQAERYSFRFFKRQENIKKDEALRRLAFEKPNIQYCIRTGAMIKACLIFKDCVQL